MIDLTHGNKLPNLLTSLSVSGPTGSLLFSWYVRKESCEPGITNRFKGRFAFTSLGKSLIQSAADMLKFCGVESPMLFTGVF